MCADMQGLGLLVVRQSLKWHHYCFQGGPIGLEGASQLCCSLIQPELCQNFVPAFDDVVAIGLRRASYKLEKMEWRCACLLLLTLV